MAGVDIEEKSSTYGTFERLLYIFLIPLIFVTILLGVLLSLFDYDVMNSFLKVANKVPLVEKFIPDAKTSAKSAATDSSPAVSQEQDQEASASALKAKLSKRDEELRQAQQFSQEKDQTINSLKSQIADLEQKLKTKTQSDEEYRKQIQQLASVYAKMTPSKSAPIIENLTLNERVLVLNEMKPDDRVKILEKMDPQRAAETSILMKELTTVKDKEIAALQERLKLNAVNDPKTAAKLSKDELAQTFESMPAKNAAQILLEMNSANQTKVLSILSLMNNANRSKVLAAISDVSRETAATLSAKLAE